MPNQSSAVDREENKSSESTESKNSVNKPLTEEEKENESSNDEQEPSYIAQIRRQATFKMQGEDDGFEDDDEDNDEKG